MTCGLGGTTQTLNPYGDVNTNYMTDLLVEGVCNLNGTPDANNRLLYVFHNVNVVNGGKLVFHDGYDTDFYAESILIENGGKLVAVSTQLGFLPQVRQGVAALPYQKRLTFHLWGAPGDDGIECQSTAVNGAPCGIPSTLWTANTSMATHMMMSMPTPPSLPKNQKCASITGYGQFLPGDDCFYQYEVQDKADLGKGLKAYFGHKVLAVSFGGSLELFGSRGVTYIPTGGICNPSAPDTECNPAFTGKSWVRLTGVSKPAMDGTQTITVSRAVDWKMGDSIVVTTTDYLPSHSEEMVLAADASGGTTIKLTKALQNDHNFSTYSLSSLPTGIGPVDDPNVDVKGVVDTRAAVALLTRNIQVVSEGNVPSVAFTETPGNYYGGHTIVRQGFASYQVQGVEFYQLGQGGAKGRYPVHFHMARKTPQAIGTPGDLTPSPLNYLKDCSIVDSMTRWVTLHATEGMYVARNVGYKSIGHGFYLEDATEINNKLYSNIGILARAAIQDLVHNPRQVPGILADNTPRDPGTHNDDYMPFRSDYNHPAVFWITNGWNDFQYNFAAGAATCGACYWWLPTSDSGPSQYETWDSYASQQIVQNKSTNYDRAGITPLKTFIGNSCVAAMSSFQMNGQTGECLGVTPSGSAKLSAVQSTAPPGPNGADLPNQPFNVYYPVASEVHNPAFCAASDCSVNINPCDGADTFKTCAITLLDHFTTSFNFAQTNFSAVWLRKGWDLLSNSAVTDVQSGGLNFITGGGYTRSDVNLGEWLVVRNSVFVGHTQKTVQEDATANPFAEDVGPFNPDSKLACDNASTIPDHCEYADGGVSFNLPPFPGQKLFNIYDGPSHQSHNAYMDINTAKIADCQASPGGTCTNSEVPLAWNYGVLQDKTKTYCYVPNAAIGWKQPNGFYYPPAFHSNNLWFQNVDIRHFVIEPLFVSIKPTEYDPFQQNQTAVDIRYCTHSVDMFSANFNNIDRQTVLNDDDGTLTGLLGNDVSSTPMMRPTISINEDDYFNAPLTTAECLSDINVTPPVAMDQPFTARTSPYEWLTTAIIADCAIVQKVGDIQCFDPKTDLYMRWSIPCTTSHCRGVPLFREYLTDTESTAKTRPQIRMMGQSTAQRSTLSLNHGAYYIDTTQNCTSQGGCPKCVTLDPMNPKRCMTYDTNPYSPSIFLGGHTYYVYFVYATKDTKQKYDIYVGPGSSVAELNVTPIRLDPNNYAITPATGTSFVNPTYTGSILNVSVDLTGQSAAFTNSKPLFCRPQAYCKSSGSSCVCDPANALCQSGQLTNSDCAWGPTDMDCPVDPANPNGMQCFGFSFTMPGNFKAPDLPIVPADDLFKLFTTDNYFAKDNVTFVKGKSISPNDSCVYNPVPVQP
ncbi:MAG TPA: hypothetical protein VE779_10530 [Candidatus Angelobacter sp.]|nr:hypothetical protein [Candidatus Angelobacter sp.]